MFKGLDDVKTVVCFVILKAYPRNRFEAQKYDQITELEIL